MNRYAKYCRPRDGEIQSKMQGSETDSDESTNDPLSKHYGDLRQAGEVNGPYSTGRLSALENPTVGKRPKKRRTQDSMVVPSKQFETKDKGQGGGRKIGKLAQLMDMPLDVFFEGRSFIVWLTLLRLIRVTTDYCTPCTS
jgi:hypothetical protein